MARGPSRDVGQGERAAAQEHGDLVRVDLVVLGLAAVDGAQVQGMAEHEVDPLLGAQVGEPVPGEHALDADDEVVAMRFDQAQEGLGLGGEVAACRSTPQ